MTKSGYSLLVHERESYSSATKIPYQNFMMKSER